MKKTVLIFLFSAILFSPFSFGRVYAQESNVITCDQALDIISTPKCQNWIIKPEIGVWCNMPPDLLAYQKYSPSYIFPPGVVCSFEESEGNQESNVQTSAETDASTTQDTKQSKPSQDVKPLDVKLFGVNPFETWLNLKGLAEVFSYINSNAFIKDTEYIWLPGERARVKQEAESRKLWEEIRFVEESKARFAELSLKEKIRAGEIVEKWDTRVEAATQPVIIQQDPATLQLQPLNGQPGVLEPEPYWPMLKSGALDVIVEPQNGRQFQMQTPNTEIFVIGTEFSVIYDSKKEQTVVAVYKGQVEVKTKDGQKTLVSANGNEPGMLVVSQKLSVLKIVIVGLVLVIIISAVAFFVKKRLGSPKKIQRKR